jgi:hypothetical protein
MVFCSSDFTLSNKKIRLVAFKMTEKYASTFIQELLEHPLFYKTKGMTSTSFDYRL